VLQSPKAKAIYTEDMYSRLHRDREQRHRAKDRDINRPESETDRPVAETYSPATKAFCTVDQNHVGQNRRGRYIQ
jgi:hypothetical protein